MYTSLLRNNLIPEDQINEANRRVAQRVNGFVPPDQDVPILERAGYFSSLRTVAFAEKEIQYFNWANLNAELLVETLVAEPPSRDVLVGVSEVFGRSSYPWDLAQAINGYFNSNADARDQFQQAFQSEDIPIPRSLESLLQHT